MSYSFSVVELAEIKVAGLVVETDMQNAGHDCPALWQSFGTKLGSNILKSKNLFDLGCVYGIAKMIDENRFTYWAATVVGNIKEITDEVEITTIPQGLYVKCAIENLQQLGEAYMAMYHQWSGDQQEYHIDITE